MVSSFFICKQPLIYDHIVHFNLLNIQRKKKKKATIPESIITTRTI